MGAMIGLEGQPIGAQPIVIEMPQVELGLGGIVYHQATPPEPRSRATCWV